MDLFDLSGKTALVTGSSRGLGRIIAHGLGEAGALVVLNGRDEARLMKALGEFRADGIKAQARRFDVTDEAQVEEAVEWIESEVALIDILVNNAGVNLRGPLEEFETAKWRQVMATNLDGVFYVSRTVGRRMVKRRAGKIINIASLLSEGGRATAAPYAASKGAVKMLTRALAVEWGRHNVQVNAIGPGYFVTEMTMPLRQDKELDAWVRGSTPAGRWGEPRELIGAAVFLASEASSYVNGQVIYVDGGWLASL